MTGYGRGGAERAGWRAVAEIRSVNHRYTDLKLRGSQLDPALEERISSAVRARVERGAVTVTLRLESAGSASGVRVDLDAARRVHAALSDIARELRLAEPVSLALVCAQPGVLVPAESNTDTEALTECMLEAVGAALTAMIEMRDAEGAILARDLEGRLDHLVQLVDQLDELVARAPGEAYRRLEERLSRLLQSAKVELDRDRLAQEVAMLADRHDVTEELVRLRSHVEQARTAMRSSEASVGRQLGFLVQEFGREFNTVSSKSQSAEIVAAVVEAKAELEKMREQVQNIE
ncbi:MAG TPA: YicC/YloC family endoribonuclease [Kofleriaceae bacterium]|nr:YicC/YloC family endoribonuclease [Kofleriaceae bacterium]